MKRSQIKRKAAPAAREATQCTYTPRPRAQAVAVAGPARATVQVPKGPKAKPGKEAPTAEERAWLQAIVEDGCIACRKDWGIFSPGAVHHLLRGGRRMGHRWSICLCDPGHHQNGQLLGVVSRHPFKARFESQYGSEAELLAETSARVGIPAPAMEANQ